MRELGLYEKLTLNENRTSLNVLMPSVKQTPFSSPTLTVSVKSSEYLPRVWLMKKCNSANTTLLLAVGPNYLCEGQDQIENHSRLQNSGVLGTQDIRAIPEFKAHLIR